MFPAPSQRRVAVLLSSRRRNFCRDYRCNHTLHVWLSFLFQKKKEKKKKKAPSLQSESISRLRRNSSLEVAGPPRLIAHPEAVPLRVGAGGVWHTSMNLHTLASASVCRARTRTGKWIFNFPHWYLRPSPRSAA